MSASPPSNSALRPTLRLMLSHPAHVVALGFGSGLAPAAPGTFGTLVAIPIAYALWTWSNDVVYLAVTVGLLFLGAWCANRTGAALGEIDDGAIVVDEIVAFLFVLFFVGPDALRIALAFALFRFFDIVKPPPIRTIDRRMKTGLGVMVDDLVAAGFTLIVFALIVRMAGWP